VALAHVHGVPAPLPDDIPPAVRDVITTGMAKNPSQRFTSAAAMATAARRAAAAGNGYTARNTTSAAWQTGRANVPRYADVPPPGNVPYQPTMRFAHPDAEPAGGFSTFEQPTDGAYGRSRSRRHGLVIAATLVVAAAVVAVLVAMTNPGSHPGGPSVVRTNTAGSTTANKSGAHGGAQQSTAPGAPGAPGASSVGGGQAPKPSPTKTGKPTPHPTVTLPTTLPPSLPPTIPPSTSGILPSTPPVGGGSAPAGG
jgi:serine/threonine-protein kinase